MNRNGQFTGILRGYFYLFYVFKGGWWCERGKRRGGGVLDPENDRKLT